MRTSLLQSILPKCKENIQRGFTEFGLFEINIPHIKGYLDADSLPKEEWHLSSIFNKEKVENSGSSYYWGKQYIEKILNQKECNYILIADSLEQDLPEDIKTISPMFDANVSAICFLDKVAIGVVGELKRSIREEYKLSEYSCAIDINLNRVLELDIKREMYVEVPIYPTFSIDFTFETTKSTPCQKMILELEKIIKSKDSWGRVECIDIYEDKKRENLKRTTLRLIASKYDKTASDKDIKNITEKIIKRFKEVFEAEVI